MNLGLFMNPPDSGGGQFLRAVNNIDPFGQLLGRLFSPRRRHDDIVHTGVGPRLEQQRADDGAAPQAAAPEYEWAFTGFDCPMPGSACGLVSRHGVRKYLAHAVDRMILKLRNGCA